MQWLACIRLMLIVRAARVGFVQRVGPGNGEVAEWSKAHAWKVCRRGTVSRVRIPVSPPFPNLAVARKADTGR